MTAEIWDQPGNDPPLYRGPLTPAEDVAEAIVAAIDSDWSVETTRTWKEQG